MKEVKIIKDILNEDLYDTCLNYAIKQLTSDENSLKTNCSWNNNIVKDSEIVLIHKLRKNSDLFNKIKESLVNGSKKIQYTYR